MLIFSNNLRTSVLSIFLFLTGSALVFLSRLPRGQIADEWYPLLSTSHSRVEVGNVRLKTKFMVRCSGFCYTLVCIMATPHDTTPPDKTARHGTTQQQRQQHNTTQHSATQRNTKDNARPHNATQNPMQHNAVQHKTQHNTAQQVKAANFNTTYNSITAQHSTKAPQYVTLKLI